MSWPTVNVKIQILTAFMANPQIMDVDQEKGVLTTLLWLDLSWDDDYLRWVGARFQGLECWSTSTN